LTIGVLKLFTDTEKQAAVRALVEGTQRIAVSHGITAASVARVGTLEYMNDDPSKVCGDPSLFSFV
jgi:hypothetical protein